MLWKEKAHTCRYETKLLNLRFISYRFISIYTQPPAKKYVEISQLCLFEVRISSLMYVYTSAWLRHQCWTDAYKTDVTFLLAMIAYFR